MKWGWGCSVFYPIPSFVHSSQGTPRFLSVHVSHPHLSAVCSISSGSVLKPVSPNIVWSSLLGAASLLRVIGSEIFLRKLFTKPRTPQAGLWGEITSVKTPPLQPDLHPHPPGTHWGAWVYAAKEQSLASTQRIRSIGTVSLGFVNGTS